ncbi:MAG TPA: Hpt domain-containing protein [Nitrospiraceae bacterium]|jgi:chemosensory pili system protein ChpA (sensor histidine kinase/response regulator)|nr:Hpt domain-containing protein [Nitrospiraceae bacterium]
MSGDFDRESLISIFVAEATDGVTTLWTALHPAEQALPTKEALQEYHVIGHKLKGAALIYGYSGLAKLGETLETVLERASAVAQSDWPRLVSALRELVKLFRSQLEVIGRGGQEDAGLIEKWMQHWVELAPSSCAHAPSDAGAEGELLLSADYLVPKLDAEALSYFAPEAQEYLEVMEGLLLRLEKSPEDAESIQHLFRTAHTLKGSAHTVGFQAIGDVAHPVEDCLGAVREGRLRMSSGLIDLILKAVDVIRALMRRDPSNLERLRQDVLTITKALRQAGDGGRVEGGQVFPEDLPHRAVQVHETPTLPSIRQEVVAEEKEWPDTYLAPNLDPEVLSYFAPEAQEYIETIEALVLRLEKEPQGRDTIHQLFRTAHTLKGSAYTVGFQAIGDLTHHVEDFMGAVRDGRVQVMSGHTDIILRAVDVVRVLMRRDLSAIRQTRERFAAVMRDLKRLDQLQAVQSPSENQQLVEPTRPAQTNDQQMGHEAHQQKGHEPKGQDGREVIRVSRDRLERLLNLVGELVIGRGRLEQRLLVLEQLSHQVLACKNRLLDSVRTFEDKHAFSYTLPTITSASVESTSPVFQGLSDFGTLEFDKYDDFNILARRISEITADISESMAQLSGSIRRAREDMSQLQQLTLSMRDEIARARMVPIGSPFTRFSRATREMARATGKEVILVTSGEHTEVDTGVVERLVDPLIHLVRNAVYHGIEPTAVRVAQGKPAQGTVYLHAAHRGNSVIIEVEDDGAGLDIDRIRAKAVALGLVRPEVAQSLPESEVSKFIFLPGFSTAEQVGDQAGRGVGLDVVKRVIETMNGHLDVESVRGVGTKFTLQLPLTLLIATALIVRVGPERYAIPLPSVREVTMPFPGSIQRVADRTILRIGDEAIEVQPLQRLLQMTTESSEGLTPIVIVRTASGPFGLTVDELLGRQEIVIKTLGTLKPLQRSCFSGATIDPEGRVILVLDVARLVAGPGHEPIAWSEQAVPQLESGEAQRNPSGIPEAVPSDLPILLIDDSLSIRKFVGRMLESAGYRVDTAVDGEDGLRKASTQAYRLIITDLEMPKLNGYEVIQALRSRPQTQATPILVMTTRAGEKHRQMAISIGATSYIAKPVEERALVREIGRWIGQEAAAKV